MPKSVRNNKLDRASTGKIFDGGLPRDATLQQSANGGGNNDSYAESNSSSDDALQKLNQQYAELCSMVETEKRKKKALGELKTKLSFLLTKKRPLEEMELDELLEFEREIMGFQKARDLLMKTNGFESS